MKNACIVGYGAIGPIHAAALSSLDSAKLYAVCDISPDALKNARGQYDVICYDDFDRMIEDKNIDSVHICTPHYLHWQMIKKALAAGKMVVCEKPVTMTAAEFDQLLATEGSNKVCVVMQNRLNPCVLKLKELIDANKYGKIKTAKAVITWCRNADYYASGAWRGKKATEGGGVLINQAVHTLDLLCHLIGEVASVRASSANLSLPHLEIEDTISANLNFKDGTKALFFATNSYGSNPMPELELVFEQCSVEYRASRLYLNGTLIAEDISSTGEKAYWGIGHKELIRRFYDSGEHFSPQDIANTMYTMFSIYESANNKDKEVIL